MPAPSLVSCLVPTVLAALLLLPGEAAADVTVAASQAEAGARDVTITFRVTNADPAVPTTRLAVYLPTVRPLVGVRATAPRGWTARVTATAVVWEGGSLVGADEAAFPLAVDRLPDGAGPLRFHVVQTVASGATEEWSDLVTYGRPAPAHPALEIPYGPPVPPASPSVHQHHADDTAGIGAGRGGVAGLVVVVTLAGAAVASAVGALGRRQQRRLSPRGRRS